tara:strand:- start:109 stop:1158 length:1050 start_codon:yes stop_codon:yes gene_type:complete
MNFVRKELKEFRESKGLLIDVRSPGEYYKGHMPNSINIPLFNNEERAIVGISYKQNGKREAIIKGLEIVENKLDNLISEFISAEKIYIKNKKLNSSINRFKIYCARGGMRSKSIFWLLSKLNYSVMILNGGYKNYRRSVLNKFNESIKIIIIGGKTGTGKTKLLNNLRNKNYQIIDLEFLANHRGSTFGSLGMKEQPSNEHFENLIAENLYNFDKNKEIYIEAESANIGKCRVPYELFKQMKESPRIEIIRSETDRINELVSTYSIYSKIELINSIKRITKRLGHERTKLAIKSVESANWVDVCKAVLEYYDKCYEYELKEKNNIKILDLSDVNENQIISLMIKKGLIK